MEYLTNSSMMGVDFLPRHLIVVGGSYVGLEFGQMFRRFGSEVTIIEMGPRLIQREDEDVSAAIKEILEGEGIAVRLNAKCIAFSKRGEETLARVDCTEGAPEVSGSHVLLAVGRRPNTDDLGLEKAGVATDARGYIVVDDQLRTSVPGIWALGDCNGKGAFTHTSYNDGEIASANLLDNDPRRVSDRITAYALYVDPPLGRAGMTEAEVRKTGRKALIGKRPMTKVGRAVEKGETQGFMKIDRGCGNARDSGRRDSGRGRRRGDSLDSRRDVRQGAVYGDSAGGAHSPDGVGAGSDDARGTEGYGGVKHVDRRRKAIVCPTTPGRRGGGSRYCGSGPAGSDPAGSRAPRRRGECIWRPAARWWCPIAPGDFAPARR